MAHKALVVGGSNGIGLAIALQLREMGGVVIVDRVEPDFDPGEGISFVRHDILEEGFIRKAVDNGFSPQDIDILVITAGLGRIAPFETFEYKEIEKVYGINAVGLTDIIRYYYPRMLQKEDFFCAVMGSIAGMLSSPLFALYSASKAAVCRLSEALNIELEAAGSGNRILNVSPGVIAGTKFDRALSNDLSKTEGLAYAIIERMLGREVLFIPDYDEVYGKVLERYHRDAHSFGLDSYRHKLDGGRICSKPQIKTGYLSGTFDLFHIGHLNLLRRAKQYCDYLVVGVHRDASHKGKEAVIPFEERCEILRSIKYVDRVIESLPEDDEVYRRNIVKYDFLFVGSDYQGSERFNRYEEYFKDKGVRIVYFPYTVNTNSTKLRETLDAITG